MKPAPSSTTSRRTASSSASEGDRDACRLGVALDVAERLGGRAVDEPLVGLARARLPGSTASSVSSPRASERREEVGERRLEPARAQVGRVDLDEQRAQAAHRVPRPGRRVAERRPRGGRRLGLRGRAQRVRDPGEVLDGAVVEVGRDPAPLVGGRLDGAHEQRLALLLRSLQPPAEPPRERHLHEPEQEEAAEQERGERQPDAPPGRCDGAPALVRLEEERRPVRRADGQVDLVEVAVALARTGSRARSRSLSSARVVPVRSTSRFASSSGKRDPISRGSSE